MGEMRIIQVLPETETKHLPRKQEVLKQFFLSSPLLLDLLSRFVWVSVLQIKQICTKNTLG